MLETTGSGSGGIKLSVSNQNYQCWGVRQGCSDEVGSGHFAPTPSVHFDPGNFAQ